MDKQTVIHLDNGTLFSDKEKCFQATKTHRGTLNVY